MFAKSDKFRKAYYITAALMALVIAAAIVLFFLKKTFGVGLQISTLCIETAAVLVFGGYWCIKSRELRGLG